MQYLHVYKEIVVNYGEVAEALKKLGFQDISTSKHFRLVNSAHNSEVKLPARPSDAIFSKVNLAGYSYQLYMQGVIEEYDDLAKLVEKNRSANTASIAA